MKITNRQNVYIALAGLLMLIGWFYWFQWRPSEIRKNCFKEVYSENTNLEWAKGKEWKPYKTGEWGWLFPYWELETYTDIYKGCLLYNGLK